VILTDAGARYFNDIGAAFGLITGATERLLRLRADEPLSLRVYSTFAAKWLMRRLSSWEQEHPDIRVRIATALVPVDFLRDSVDASIEVGDANWREGVEAELLFENTVMPVCSPHLLTNGPPIKRAEDVLHYRLIHSRFRPLDWHDWLHAFGLAAPDDADPLIFSDSLLAYQAAADGLGIAQGQPRFLVDELASGTLVPACPFAEPVKLRRAYYFVTPRLGANAVKARLFLQWLQRELKRDAV